MHKKMLSNVKIFRDHNKMMSALFVLIIKACKNYEITNLQN